MQSDKRKLFEQEKITTAVIRLAVPTVIGQIVLVIYNIADTFFVSLTGYDVNISAVTVCLPAFMVLSAISNLFGIGGASAIARAMGRNDRSGATLASATAFWGCLSATLLYSLSVAVMMHPAVRLLGGISPEVHLLSCRYMFITVVFGGTAASMSALMSHLLRSEGQAMLASFGISLGGILNVALDPLFMFVLLPKGSEVIGAALATALSNLVALLFFVIAFIRLRTQKRTSMRILPRQKVTRGYSRAELERILRDILSAGTPACLMTLCENISYAVLGNLMAQNSIAAHAGIGVAKKVNMLAHCITRGMAQGVMPLISYNYGSGNFRRMKSFVLASMMLCISMACACTAGCLAFSEGLVGLFIHEATDSRAFGVVFLRILCIGGPFSACAYTFISFFQAVGEGFKSVTLALLRKGAVDIPLMLLLSGTGSVLSIIWATPATDVICSVAAVLMFVRYLRRHRHTADSQAAIG